MITNEKLAKVFMRTAFDFASLSRCVSHKVGCIAVKDNRIIATGVNGTAPGYMNCDEVFIEKSFDREEHHEFSDKYEIHAEMNMILFAVREGISLNNASLFVTLNPCWNCIKHLSVTGIKNIWYYNEYDRTQTELNNIDVYCRKLSIGIHSFKEYFGEI